MPDFEQPNSAPPVPYVVLVVDESGSMSPSRETTVSAINDYLLGLQGTLPGASRVFVVKFDSDYARGGVGSNYVRIVNLIDGAPLSEVKSLTIDQYKPNGGTPLHDAVGRTIQRVDSLVKESEGPVYFGVVTDGGENSSVEFRLATIKQLVDQRTELGWTFAFMGVDIDAYAAGGSMGFSAINTVKISRGKILETTATLARSVGAKSTEYFTTFAASGGNLDATRAAYSSWNKTDATFTDEDRTKLEE